MKDFGCFLELGLGFKEEGNLENFSFVEMGKKRSNCKGNTLYRFCDFEKGLEFRWKWRVFLQNCGGEVTLTCHMAGCG